MNYEINFVNDLNIYLNLHYRNRIRACVNIMGDAYGAAIIEALSKKELEMLPYVEDIIDEEAPMKGHENSTTNHVNHATTENGDVRF